MDQPTPVSVEILGKEYLISCPESEKEALLAAARYLDEKMRDVKESGKIIGTERISVVAALNISHELLQHKFTDHHNEKQVRERLQNLQKRITRTLDDTPQLPI